MRNDKPEDFVELNFLNPISDKKGYELGLIIGVRRGSQVKINQGCLQVVGCIVHKDIEEDVLNWIDENNIPMVKGSLIKLK